LEPALEPAAEPSATAEDGSSPSVLRCTAFGSIAGTTLRTFSAPAQRLFHLGYGHLEDRPVDVLADDVLAALSARPGAPVVASGRTAERTGGPSCVPSTLLLVPIFSLPYGLWRLCKQFGNDLDAIPPHVTVAYPFLPLHRVDATVLEELASIFAGHEPFDFDLASLGWFGDDVVYLEPSRPERFTTLTAALQQSFPAFRPYDGAFDSVVPHVTLSAHETATGEQRRVLAALSQRYLPVAAQATHVWLMSNKRHPDHWSIERFFPLGTAANERGT
ncbi:MAG: 2'-5' RNA ligase family protein, partial [Acidimicrobiales bacterium]